MAVYGARPRGDCMGMVVRDYRMRFLPLLLLAGCACPGDANRIVHPISWQELESKELHDVCRDYDERLRGCVVSGPDGDRIYVLPLEKHVGTEL